MELAVSGVGEHLLRVMATGHEHPQGQEQTGQALHPTKPAPGTAGLTHAMGRPE